jgi:phosphate starvation-inducible protein PhoH and related proteins
VPRRNTKVAKRANRENPRIDRHPPQFQDQDFHRTRRVELIPRNLAQEKYIDALYDDQKPIVFAVGPAGSGKTLLGTEFAIKGYQEGRFKKIVITRPAISVDEQHGFLPGNIFEKMQPWMMPILDVFKKYYSLKTLQYLIANDAVEIAPLAYMRGRAQPLSSIIQSPLGPVRMGDIRPGDTVLGSNGRSIEVTGVFPQGKRQVYRVSFSDDISALVSGDHLWVSQTRSEKKHRKGFTVKSTEQILASGIWKARSRNHEVPVLSAPVEFTLDLDLPVDAYILGALLGDGTMHETASPQFTTADQELVDAFEKAMPEHGMVMKPTRSSYDYRLVGTTHGLNPLKNALRNLRLSGCRAYEKRIPEEYLYARAEDRIALLQGLMDTDGTGWKQSARSTRMQYTSTSHQLASDVAWLVRSLGGTATVRERVYDLDAVRQDAWQIFHRRNSFVVEICLPVSIQPFRLTRKQNELTTRKRPSRYIDSIEPVGMMECQCISVSADDQLYLTDDFIVTHNTFADAIVIADEMQNSTISQTKMVLTRIGDKSRMIVTGDLQQHDRGYDINGMKDFIERLKRANNKGIAVIEFTSQDVVRHPIIEDILRIYGE